MALIKRIGFVVLCLAPLVIAGTWGRAQTLENRLQAPVIMSGGDLGFRVEGRRGNAAIGTLVVRINGQWVVAEPAGSLKPLTAK